MEKQPEIKPDLAEVNRQKAPCLLDPKDTSVRVKFDRFYQRMVEAANFYGFSPDENDTDTH